MVISLHEVVDHEVALAEMRGLFLLNVRAAISTK